MSLITDPFPGTKEQTTSQKGVLGKWVGNGNTYVLSQIGTVPNGFPDTGQQQTVTIAGNHYWLFQELTHPPSTLETIGIIGAITGVVAGITAGAAVVDAGVSGGTSAASTAASEATAGEAAAGGAAGGSAATAAGAAASKVASSVGSLGSDIKGLAALGAIGTLLTDPQFYLRVIEVVAGLYLLFLGVKTLTTGSTSPKITIQDIGGGSRPIRSSTVSRPRAARATNRPANSPRSIRLRREATKAALESP